MDPLTFGSILKRPSAFLPLAMSMIALTLVLAAVGLSGIPRNSDEGAVAHLWQLLMAGQVPIILFFAIRWLPRSPRLTLFVLAQQAGAALASLAAVFFFKLG
ncbi:hypothetical protein [Granulicella sibirica]|uniref:Uncharacterized protein n=1 Tax=Granulicella sibirica TaxID=2479048 RepID=A0A4Q0T3C0_9BACT|nr:hypothetical protein [Granulicella sibirica]RXH57402.1 hypothetical protein GRAN_0712 [Granulicella sibirica]